MYKVYSDSNLIHHDNLESLRIFNPSVELELNKTGSFVFTIYPWHPYYALIRKLTSIITVWQDDYLLFRGRVLNDEIGFHNEKTISCEGDMAFLLDSIQRPSTFNGTAAAFLQRIINNHNAQVDASRQFTIGTVSVSGSVSVSTSDYTSSFETIKKQLQAVSGGYLRTRQANGVNYIDYLNTLNTNAQQQITFGKNLLGLKRTRKGEDIITAVIPLGAKLLDAEGKETDERLTIKSVNSGLDYISNQSAVTQYGFIVKSVIFEDITSAPELLQKGQTYLNANVNLMESIELSAADLATIDTSVEAFRLGTQVQVKSVPHALDQKFLVRKLSINLLDPAASKLTLGKTISTFTESSVGIKGEPGKQGIPGAKGAAGTDGTGVQSVSEEFYLSTSKTAQSGGAWSTTAPVWKTGTYLWTRTKVTYTSGKVEYTTPVCDSSWEAVNELDIGGRNLISGSKSMETYSKSGNVTLAADDEGIAVATFAATTALSWNSVQTREPIPLSVVRGKQVTLSFFVRTDDWEALNQQTDRGLNIGFALCPATATTRIKYMSNGMYARQLSTEWEKITWTATLTDDFFAYGTGTIEDDTRLYIQIYNYSLYSMQVKKVKLEFGNVATDWTPSPDDQEAKVAEAVEQLESKMETDISKSESGIKTYVGQTYYLKTNGEALGKQVSSLSTSFSQTSQAFEMRFTGVEGDITTMQSYIRYEAGNIILGEEGNELTLRISNDKIVFIDENQEVAYFSNNKLYVTDGDFVNILRIGNFAFYPRENGNLSFSKFN